MIGLEKNTGLLVGHCLIGLGVGPHLPSPATPELIFFKKNNALVVFFSNKF
jgi:hypothetical protein